MKILPYRRSSLLTLCVLGGLGLSFAAYAGDSPKSSSGHGMKMMDADHDGKITATEHAAGAKKMFDTMDTDKDGRVTAAEMDMAHKGMPNGHDKGPDKSGKAMKTSAEKIKVVDTDQDGVLTAAEHAAGSQKMFGKMDADKDGNLSAAEIQAGHDRMLSAEDR